MSLPIGGSLQPLTATLYTAPSGKRASIDNITVVNNGAAQATINIFARAQGTNRSLCPKDLALPAGFKAQEDVPIHLAPGDTIDGNAAGGDQNAINFFISGVETPLV